MSRNEKFGNFISGIVAKPSAEETNCEKLLDDHTNVPSKAPLSPTSSRRDKIDLLILSIFPLLNLRIYMKFQEEQTTR